jgi:uncharacterized membrane protein
MPFRAAKGDYVPLAEREGYIGGMPPAKVASVPLTDPPLWRAAVVFALGTLLVASEVTTILSTEAFATNFVSPPTWRSVAIALSTSATTTPDAVPIAFSRVFLGVAMWSAITLALGAGVIRWRSGRDWGTAFRTWADHGWRWWCAAGLWEWAWVVAATIAGENGAAVLVAVLPFWIAICLAGRLTTLCTLGTPGIAILGLRPRRATIGLSALIACYVILFTAMNGRLWFNLYIPHGDSAMYEEHLWNLLHGKGFRSYLDQGLFLGEHIQFVHLGLIPLYVLWPSHLLLELCESAALACGAIPVFWMSRRHTGSDRIALAAAAAFLLYFPMQFLDIEIDLKTFRPEAFGIPILLFALDQLDRGRWMGFLIGGLACLTVKEDYAIILSPLGLWIAITAWRSPATLSKGEQGRRWLVTGLALAVFGVVYLWLATRVLMPWFRPGQEIHYTSYFSRLGDSPEAIVRTMLTRPGFVLGEVANLSTMLYGLALLAPVGFVALLSPGRLAVSLPLFGILCLNELDRTPRHQFHAPLVAIVFWAVACGLGNLPAVMARLRRKDEVAWSAAWLWTCAFATGLWFSLSPLSVTFWDPGSSWYWRKLYGPTPRAAAFVKIAPLIPQSARVASTDFVHPRFTHHERSYDYSDYIRKVSGYERRVPDDTEYIVIDATHPYSRYHRPEDVPEFHDTVTWELLPDETGGNFIVLRRRMANRSPAD